MVIVTCFTGLLEELHSVCSILAQSLAHELQAKTKQSRKCSASSSSSSAQHHCSHFPFLPPAACLPHSVRVSEDIIQETNFICHQTERLTASTPDKSKVEDTKNDFKFWKQIFMTLFKTKGYLPSTVLILGV